MGVLFLGVTPAHGARAVPAIPGTVTFMRHPHRRRVLIDLDETCFPFAHAYHDWLVGQGQPGLGWDGLDNYNLDRALGGNRRHDELAELFLLDPSTVDTAPIAAAKAAMVHLHRTGWEIWLVTARFAAKETAATTAWVEHHFPFVEGRLLLTRTYPEGPSVTKPSLAWALGAEALIDDYCANFDNLPDFCQGLLIQRPEGLPNDEVFSASIPLVDWATAVAILDAKADTDPRIGQPGR